MTIHFLKGDSMLHNTTCWLYIIILLSGFGILKSEHNAISYSQDQMRSHKAKCIARMQSSPKDNTYQLDRAIKTINGDDADYIPKVPRAGEIFFDENIRYQLMHNGIKIYLNGYYDAQWITDVIYGLKGHHEPQEEKCFYEVLKYMPNNAIMIELGSYWAYYSLWFALQIPGAKNYLGSVDFSS